MIHRNLHNCLSQSHRLKSDTRTYQWSRNYPHTTANGQNSLPPSPAMGGFTISRREYTQYKRRCIKRGYPHTANSQNSLPPDPAMGDFTVSRREYPQYRRRCIKWGYPHTANSKNFWPTMVAIPIYCGLSWKVGHPRTSQLPILGNQSLNSGYNPASAWTPEPL